MPRRAIFGNYDLAAANTWEQLGANKVSMTEGVILKARASNTTFIEICAPGQGVDPNVTPPAPGDIARLEPGDAPTLPLMILAGVWVRSSDAAAVLDLFGASAY
jgi:hypothetical protein